jgi:hypothetical protein
MIVIEDLPTVYFDVDDTLVLWPEFGSEDFGYTLDLGAGIFVRPHEFHIQKLKEHKVRGHKVVVWSQGGSEWAEKVCKALGIEAYVDVVISKPRWFYDDLPASAFLHECDRIWIEPR